MFNYNYLENLTLEQLNNLGSEGWEIVEATSTDSETFNAFFKKGFQDKTLIENESTGANFWVSENISYGEAMILIFITIFIFCLIGKVVYNFLFKND